MQTWLVFLLLLLFCGVTATVHRNRVRVDDDSYRRTHNLHRLIVPTNCFYCRSSPAIRSSDINREIMNASLEHLFLLFRLRRETRVWWISTKARLFLISSRDQREREQHRVSGLPAGGSRARWMCWVVHRAKVHLINIASKQKTTIKTIPSIENRGMKTKPQTNTTIITGTRATF